MAVVRLVFLVVASFIALNAAADDTPADTYIQMLESGDMPAEKPKPDDIPLLISQLSAPEARIRANAEWMLAQPSVIGRAAAAEPFLLKNLEFPDVDVQAGAVNALGRLKSTAAVPALQRLLFARDASGRMEHRVWSVRLLAARALGDIGPVGKATIPELQRMAGNKAYRSFALEALAYIGDRAAIPIMMQVLDPSTLDSQEMKPVNTLKPGENPYIWHGATDKVSAVDALTELNATQAIPLFIEDLRLSKSYNEGKLRIHLAKALGKLKAESAIPVLKEALKDDFNDCSPPLDIGNCYAVRAAAREGLREIGTPAALEALKPWWHFW